MIIDNLPLSPLVNKDGTVTNEWRNSLQQLVTQLQLNLSNEKYQLPLQPAVGSSATQAAPVLDSRSNWGAIYHNSISNNPCVNMKIYSATNPTQYQFTPIPTLQNVSTVDDLNTIPSSEINGKQVTVDADPNKIYVGVGTNWQVITTSNP